MVCIDTISALNIIFWMNCADVVPDFEEPEYSVVENGTFVEVCVLVNGILERNLTLTISTRDQTAVGEFTASVL